MSRSVVDRINEAVSSADRAWLVVIDGAGEYQSDFQVIVLAAPSAREAVERVTAPDMGYGKDDDGIAYAMPLDSVQTFRINEARHKHVAPSLTIVPMPEYEDPDGLLPAVEEKTP